MVFFNKNAGRMTVECPKVPNFVRVDGVMRPLSYLTEKELTSLAEEWAMHLADKRKNQLRDGTQK